VILSDWVKPIESSYTETQRTTPIDVRMGYWTLKCVLTLNSVLEVLAKIFEIAISSPATGAVAANSEGVISPDINSSVLGSPKLIQVQHPYI